jgi:hypothetical protein
VRQVAPAYSGFPVELIDAGTLHAAFLVLRAVFCGLLYGVCIYLYESGSNSYVPRAFQTLTYTEGRPDRIGRIHAIHSIAHRTRRPAILERAS